MKLSATKHLLIVVLFVTLGSLIYSNTLEVSFVFDDIPKIQENPHIRITELSLSKLAKAGFKSSATRPFVFISFALNYYFHQFNLKGYHIVNIIIHLMTAVLLYFFIRTTLSIPLLSPQYSQPEVIAFFAALVWLVHPLHTQSVTYIVQRFNSMAAMFYVLSLWLYVKGRLVKTGRKSWPWFAVSALAGILALGCKQNAAMLPFFILLYEWYFFQDLDQNWFKRHLKYVLGVFVLFGLIAMLYLGTNPFVKLKYLRDFSYNEFTLTERILTQFRVVIYYLSLLVFPHPSRLNLDYDFPLSHSLIDPVSTLLCLVAVAGFIGLAVYMARKERLLSFCILWFFGNLIIESSVIPLAVIYEHRTYLPSMLICLLAVALGYRYIKVKWAGVALVCIITSVFSLWTYQRNSIWSDPVLFWSDCVEKSPQKARPHSSLGLALADQGKLDEAIGHYSKALQFNPDLWEAHNNLGKALVAVQGPTEEAVGHFIKAIQLRPRNMDAYNNLGVALMRVGKIDYAVAHLQKALQIDPDIADTHINLGIALLAKGRLEDAIAHFRQALRIKPYIPEVHVNLGTALINKGEIDTAIAHFREALRLKPDYAAAQDNLKQALAVLKEIDTAIYSIKAALNLHPENPGLYYNLGILYHRKGDLNAAGDAYQQALSIEPEFIEALNNLALTYMVQNENDKALALFTKLTALQPDNAGHYYNLACIYSRQNQIEASIDRLKKAVEKGYDNWALIKTDKDLENTRNSSYYQEFVKGH